jgi:glycosyltransferase involved in cell wall biosynthesis
MRRVLILCEYPTLLGGERSLLATLPAVRAAGFEVHVAAPGIGPLVPTVGPLASALVRVGVHHIPWQVHDLEGERLPLERLRADVTGFLHDVQPHLLHANSLSMSRIAGPVAATCGVPSIGHIRDIVTLSRQAVADVNANRRLVAVSHATREFHVTQGIAADKCIVVYNGVDLDEFQPRRPSGYWHKKLGLNHEAQLIATIGQLGPRKGMDVVLRAAFSIAPLLPGIHWLIVGERTSNKTESRFFEGNLKGTSHVPQLRDQVHFLGSRNDVPQLLNECSLLVHGARQEPLGRVLLEAAASGVAVVATDVGGTREIFRTELDGAILVPPDDERAMADVMLALLQNEARRQSLARAARRRAEEAFDIRNAAQRLVAQYEEVLNG